MFLFVFIAFYLVYLIYLLLYNILEFSIVKSLSSYSHLFLIYFVS